MMLDASFVAVDVLSGHFLEGNLNVADNLRGSV